MSDRPSGQLGDLSVDTDSLYQEEVFTDLRAATVRRLSPVGPDGAPDPKRPVLFIGETTLVSQVGPIPVQCPIEADSLERAFDRFPEAVREAIDRLNERAQELRRDEASRIVVPQGGIPPELAGGGLPGGKIVLDK